MSKRMESANKKFKTRILVSKETIYQLDGFLTRELGEFLLKGKEKPIVIYELICRDKESNGQQKSLCHIFSEALSAYRKQSWEDAIKILNKSLKICKEDGPSRFYLEQCRKYRKKPPGDMWDGIVRLGDK